jgi:hypothetical protein
MYVLLAGVCLMCIAVMNVNAADDIQKKVIGKWEITIPDAPDEYNQFDVEIKEVEGVIIMNLKGGDIDIKEQKFTLKDGKLTSNLYVGENVQIVLFEEKGVIKGTADTSMGVLPFVMKKKEEKKTK